MNKPKNNPLQQASVKRKDQVALRKNMLIVMSMILLCLSGNPTITAQNTPQPENNIYSIEELHEIFLSRVHDCGEIMHKDEKDAKLIYSIGMHTDSIFAIGYKPKAMKAFSHKNLDTSTEEWITIRNRVHEIILANEKALIEPFKRKQEQLKNHHQYSLIVKLASISTIKMLNDMEEIRYISPMGSDELLIKSRFYDYKYKMEAMPDGEELGNSGYKIYKDKVYYSGRELKGCKANDFRKIGTFHWTDGTNVYYAGKRLPKVDIATFTVINGVPKDKNNVYYGDKIIVGADPQIYEVAIEREGEKRTLPIFFMDSLYIYHNRRRLITADLETFEILKYENPEEENNWWARDKNHVFWNWHVVEGADPASIIILNKYQARDKDEDAFILTRNKIKIDPSTFVSFPNNMIKSNTGVYHATGKLFKDADPLTFVFLNGWYQKDTNHVFYKSKIIDQSDPESFQATAYPEYAFDKHRAYYRGRAIKEVDILSWEALSKNYSKDKRQVFYKHMPAKNVDPNTFEVIYIDGKEHGKDKDGVFKFSGSRQ